MAKRFKTSKGPSQRQLRAGELIRHQLVEIFQREPMPDPKLDKVSITVSEVKASPDLRNATAFVSALGNQGLGTKKGVRDEADLLKRLNAISPVIRKFLGARLEMKYTPELHFSADGSFDEAEKIDRILEDRKVTQDTTVAETPRDDA